MLKLTFPEDFLWGTATSGPQSEGRMPQATSQESLSNIEQWFHEQPLRFHEGYGPLHATEFYVHYKEDLEVILDIGFRAFRTSLQWSSLFPNGESEVNSKAMDFYNMWIDKLLEHDVQPFFCLSHFDMPQALQQQGGFENRDVATKFLDYAHFCFDNFGDRVKHWLTFNEPMRYAMDGYVYDRLYPNVVDLKRAIQVAYNILVTHAEVVDAYHTQFGQQNGEIGIILNLAPVFPRSKEHIGDVEAANVADLLMNQAFLDPVLTGQFGKPLCAWLEQHNLKPQTLKSDAKTLSKSKVDILGVSYTSPIRVKAVEQMFRAEAPPMPEHFFSNYDMPGRKLGLDGATELYEKGLFDICERLRKEYDNIPSFIAANGCASLEEAHLRNDNGVIEDLYRVSFLEEHLFWVHTAIKAGADVRGYHMWSFTDIWEWMDGFRRRTGFVEIDLQRGFTRRVKRSAYWYRNLILDNGFVLEHLMES